MKVKNIIIALVLQKLYETEGPADLFEHSIRCATACEFLANEYKCINPDDAFYIRLLHDIGQVILKSKYPKYIDVYNEAKGNYDVLVAAEMKNFGVTHSVLGAKLLREVASACDFIRYFILSPSPRMVPKFHLQPVLYIFQTG